jgi:hypothetical protein
MRLSSPDEDSSKFRSLKIGITKESVDYDSVVERLSEKYDYIKGAIDLVDKMNKVFRSSCKGMYKFKYRLCVDEDIHLSEIKMDSSIRKNLILKSHELNEELTRIKKRFENDLSGV